MTLVMALINVLMSKDARNRSHFDKHIILCSVLDKKINNTYQMVICFLLSIIKLTKILVTMMKNCGVKVQIPQKLTDQNKRQGTVSSNFK